MPAVESGADSALHLHPGALSKAATALYCMCASHSIAVLLLASHLRLTFAFIAIKWTHT